MNRPDYETIFKNCQVGEILFQEPMKNHTTFKIGGPCDVMILPGTEQELINALQLIRQYSLPYMVIGNGSNLLVRDKGFRGIIIKLQENYSQVSIEGETVTAQAGALLSMVAKKAMKENLTGLEFASGIPGGIGGAVAMNAGAYGGEIKDILQSVHVVDQELIVHDYTCAEMNMNYRHSRVQDEKLIVLSAVFRLAKGDPEKIKELYEDLTERRTSKQPLEYASAGSTFKRPEGHFAGQLIDEAGLRGHRCGDAQVSEKHCGFIINRNQASCEEVLALIKKIQDRVYEKSHIHLEPEVKIIGEE